MTSMRPIPRYLGLAMLLATAGIAAVGYFAIRRDVHNLRVISQDNILWSATQMEVELLRFELSVAVLAVDGTAESLEDMRERFDILWSRTFMMSTGRVGQVLRRHDEAYGVIAAISKYLMEADPVVAALRPGDSATILSILDDLRGFQKQLRLFTLHVMRGDTAASAQVRDRIQSSAQTTAIISVAAVVISLLSLFLILRENRRQRMVSELNRRHAEEAEQASRAKSRFLTMMSHELRNPLNGVLGPLALLDQTDIPARQKRLVEQAHQSGQSMLRMLLGLLDYGEMQDGRFQLRREPFRVAALAEAVRASLAGTHATAFRVEVAPGMPERVHGDQDRLRQVFVHLGEYVLESCDRSDVKLSFRFKDGELVGEFTFGTGAAAMDWKLDLLMGPSEMAPDQVSADALRPLIARGLIAAAKGVLTLVDDGQGRRAIRATIPLRPVEFEKIRVHLETRSAALAAIYQAALRSERVIFAAPDGAGPVDLVLVDATSVGADPLMSQLRMRFPDALFVSLGLPQSPGYFDDIVEVPNDMGQLRTSILGRLAS